MNIELYREYVRDPKNVFDISEKTTIINKESRIHILRQIFRQEIYDLLYHEISRINNDIDYYTQFKEDKYRHKIELMNLEYLRELHITMNETDVQEKYIDYISNLFDWNLKDDCSKIEFALWLDKPGWTIPYHYDNEKIKYSIQTYMSEYRHGIGTSLSYSKQIEDTFVNIGFVQNGGYAMKNSHDFYHGMEQKVPDNYNRVSLYFIIR